MSDDAAESTEDAGIWARTTAPQSPFSSAQVGTGFLVLVIGLLVTFGLALLLA